MKNNQSEPYTFKKTKKKRDHYKDGSISEKKLIAVRFVPMTGEAQKQ